MSENRLFQDFPPISPGEWKEKIIADLKGADYQKKLVWKTDEGFDIQPFYTAADLDNIRKLQGGTSLYTNKETNGNDWLIRQDFLFNSAPEKCNEKIIHAVKRGVTSVGIDLNNQQVPGAEELEILFQGIDTTRITIHFMHATDHEKLYSALVKYLNSPGNKNNTIRGSLGFDPIGRIARTGESDETAFDRLASLIKSSSNVFPEFRILTVNAGIFQDSGSTLSQELGYALSMANEYLDQLTNRGLTPSLVNNSMMISFSTGPDYFMEIAKLRAARSLWAAVYSEWNAGTDNVSAYIHSRTASWNLTVYDPNVNMLRTTTETMSASLGGSDEITVQPFDRWFNDENEFSSRIARNIQIILKEEAAFGKVADPAAGSYYIEELTTGLTDQAWKIFLDTEKNGGFLEAFSKGLIQGQVETSAENKRKQTASRRRSILGVNQYPAFGELILNQQRSVPGTENTGSSTFPALKPFRIAEEIEKLREQTEKSEKLPKVFLLKFGEPAWRTARAMFAGNFFACAGFEIIDNTGFDDLKDGIEAARKSKADIVVLCSADDAYTSAATAVNSALHGSSVIVVAGYPKDTLETLKDAGIRHFIHVKSNLLEELKKFQALIIT